MELKVKIWLAGTGQTGCLGQGRYRLLRQIHHTGSLQHAANNLHISYRKAWGDVRSMEAQLGFALVERHRGGADGGRSNLTSRAIELLDAYGRACDDVQAAARRAYETHLKNKLDSE